MTTQAQVRSPEKEAVKEEVETEAKPGAQEKHDKELKEIDDLLDEIDSVLEENAEEFVRDYQQKSGE